MSLARTYLVIFLLLITVFAAVMLKLTIDRIRHEHNEPVMIAVEPLTMEENVKPVNAEITNKAL